MPPEGKFRDSVYILGPMRGYQFYNFPAFDKMEARIIEQGYIPVSPAQMDREIGFNEVTDRLDTFDLRAAIRRDLNAAHGSMYRYH